MPAPAQCVGSPPPTTPTVTPPRPRVKKEVVPVAAPKLAPPKPAPPSWQNAPPPVRRNAAANETQQIAPIDTGTMKTAAPNGKVDEDAVLRELAGGDGDTPPVRSDSADEPPNDETETSAEDTPPRRSRLKWIMAATVLVTLCVLGGVGFVVFWTDAHSEAERFRKGLDAYTHRQNEKATRIFSDLVADFPESENKDTYEFLRDWSHQRSQIFGPEAAGPAANIAMLAPWVKNESKNPVFAKYKDDVGETYLQVLDDRFELALRELKPEDPDAIEAELEEAAPYIPAARVIALRNKLGDLRLAIARKLLREEVIKELTKLRDNPTSDMLERAAEILNGCAAPDPRHRQGPRSAEADGAASGRAARAGGVAR